jgi:putative aminopeptidase FrvX
VEDIIRTLTEVYGPSGAEGRVRALIEGLLAGHVDEVRSDALGNLIALRRATSGQPAGRLMLAAHTDEIGLIVSYIDKKGFARFHAVGGVWPATLIGGRVVFENGTVGVIGVETADLSGDDLPEMEKLFIDVGATALDNSPVRVGDVAGFQRGFVAQGTRWICKAMDDRAGCAVLIQMLRDLRQSVYDVYAVFTSQEEVGLRGAATSAFGIEPDIAIALDVCGTGDTPESRKLAVELGKGPAIAIKDGGMITHVGLRRHLVDVAKAGGIPYQLEVSDRGTTDARAIQTTRAGVPTGLISIPCRYIHTPSEMIDAGDCRAAVDLLLRAVQQPMQFD